MDKQEIKQTQSPQLPVSEQETQIQAPSLLEKIGAQKKKILIVVFGILILAGAVFGAYKFGRRQVQPASQPTPTPVAVATTTPDETANWETYTNIEYGYSIKYPPNLYYQEWKISNSIKHSMSFRLEELRGKDIPQQPEIGITVYLDEDLYVGDWLKKHSTNKPFGSIEDPSIHFFGVETVGGTQNGLERMLFSDERYGIKTNHQLIGKNGKIYDLHYTNLLEENLEPTFNLMLSTFKFISEEAVGEKVYCKEPRPEVCTMECIVNPPYICGSDGKSYCTGCQACSKPEVEWYVIQDELCEIE